MNLMFYDPGHVGCFKDDGKRVLRDLKDTDSKLYFPNDTMTHEWCYEACQKRKFPYFGVQVWVCIGTTSCHSDFEPILHPIPLSW